MNRVGPIFAAGGWVRVVTILLGYVVAGVVAAIVWSALWQAPGGLVFKGEWYLSPTGPDVAVSGTASYVVIAVIAGALSGFGALRLPRHELTTLFGLVAGSLLAGWLMYAVGHALGPVDPRTLAAGQPDLTPFPSDLRIATFEDSENALLSPALLAWPFAGLCVAFGGFLIGGRASAEEQTH